MNRRKIEVLPEEDFAHGESPAQCNRLERKILEKNMILMEINTLHRALNM